MREPMTPDLFRPHLRTRFRALLEQHSPIELELLDVADHGSTDAHVQFAIEFAGPADAPLTQGLFRLAHDALGEQVLLLVPVARDAEVIRYEAVFNSVRPAPEG